MEKYKVLFVSKDETDQELIDCLSPACVVVHISDADEAHRLIEEAPSTYSACIMDTASVGDKARELIRQMRRLERSEAFPVFAIVNGQSDQRIEEAFDLGASDVIIRPFSRYVYHRVSNLIRLNNTSHELEESYSKLKKEQKEDHYFLDNMPGGLFRYRHAAPGKDKFDYISPGMVSIMGCRSEFEFRHHTGNTFHGMVHPDDVDEVEASIEEQIRVDGTDRVTYRIRRTDGSIRWLEDWGRLVTDEHGIEWFYVVTLDVTDMMEYQEQLEHSNERSAILSVFNEDVLFDVNYRSRSADIFGDFEKRFGREFSYEDYNRVAEQEKSLTIDEDAIVFTMHDSKKYVGDASEFDIIIPDANYEPKWTRCQLVVLRDERDRPYRCVGRFLDIHDMMMSQFTFQSEAEHDGLTDLYNRKAAMRLISEMREASDLPCTFMLLDIDNFKRINDTYGHPVGDEVLVHLASYLAKFCRGNDIVARLGGDEFCVFISGLGYGDRLDQVVAEISTEALKSFKGVEADIPPEELSLSIGVVATKDSDVSLERLYESADRALYHVKRGGRNGFELVVI